jgi:DNA-binding CsgD family transcriptional regulator
LVQEHATRRTEADWHGDADAAAVAASSDRPAHGAEPSAGTSKDVGAEDYSRMIVPSASMALVEHFPVSVMITDESLTVLHTNLRAGRFLTTEGTLKVEQGRLVSDDADKTAFLQDKVRKACRDQASRHPVVVTSLSDNVSLKSLVLRIFPIDHNWIGVDRAVKGNGLVAIMIEFGQISEAGAQGLIDTFGLSTAEFEILGALAHGRAPKEIATARASEVSTVRVHIRNLRAKMNCRTDNEAIILFHRFARF